MIGKITNIDGNLVTVKLSIDVTNQTNLVNIHVVFQDNNKKIVGEIISMTLGTATVAILGEIIGDKFIPGLSKKPAFSSSVRIVNMEELSLILGEQVIRDNSKIYLGTSSIYSNYKINISINDFFSNHFAIIGNSGSGKSSTLARIIQNIFTSTNYVPVKSNIFLFDAYGEYTNAFSNLNNISPMINYKTYTTNTNYPDTEVLKIPVWLLGVDDIALLLDATKQEQLSIIEKALKLVPILKGNGEEVLTYKNDIIARALMDILRSGKESSKIRDQVIAILTSFNTEKLNLETIIAQPGYNRTLKQCLFVDKIGKMQEMELVVDKINEFIVEGLEIPNMQATVEYNLRDLSNALDFALISEGILKSDKVFDYANILSVRLHSLINSQYSEYFNYDSMIDRSGYIARLLTTVDGKKAQIVNFNINYVNDRMAKVLTKILSKMLFDFATNNTRRGTIPFHIIVEEAHRYVQNDKDVELLGYNIFDRITKEGRKYGVILGLITQRPSELSETSVSQCSNFIILRTLHPKDLKYIEQMVPNITEEIVNNLKTLQPGHAIAFGNAFKIPLNVKIDMPNPAPMSSNSNIVKEWYS